MIATAPCPRGLGRLGQTCPYTDQANNLCSYAGMEINCNLIRECSPQTHYEYAIPGTGSNVDIWQLTPSGFQWSGPAPEPTTQPTLPSGSQVIVFQPTSSPSSPTTTPQLAPTQTYITQPTTTSSPTTVTTTPTNATVSAEQLAQIQAELARLRLLQQLAAQQQPQTAAPEPAPEEVIASANLPITSQLHIESWADKLKDIPWWVWAAAVAGAVTLSRRRQGR